MAKKYVDDHRILLVQNGKERDITRMCGDMQLDDSLDALAVTFTFSIFTAPYDKYVTNQHIAPGDIVRLVNHDNEVFTGYVETVTLDGWVTVLDKGKYLNKNEILLQCTKVAADAAIRQMCVKAGVAAGEIAPMKTLINNVWTGDTAATILEDILEACTRETGKEYYYRVEKGHLQVRELPKDPIVAYHKPAENIAPFNITWALGEISGSDSMADLRNVVILAAEDDGKVYIAAQASNPESMKKYGFLQKIETVTEDEGKAKQEQQSKTLLAQYDRLSRTRTLEEIWGADEVKSGVVLQFNTPYSGLTGLHRVTHVTHNYGSAGHMMRLELKALEQPRAVPDAADRVIVNGLPKDFNKKGSTTSELTVNIETSVEAAAETVIEGGKTVKARFTAYFPSSDPKEGGFKDRMGNWLVPANHTCAAPLSVPLGTKITVQGTGTSRDGITYTVTDSGSAIKVKADGTYCFDLLMSTRSECNAFGVRYGTAIIGGTRKKKASAVSSGAAAFVKVAAGEVGYHEGPNNDNKYGAWAGHNYQFWCCFFVCWCASKAGADPIPKHYGAVADMANYFRKRGLYKSSGSGYIPKAGDLMIQTTKHIGIVEWADASAVHTIEGNTSDAVRRRTRSYGEITGFCTPWG